jgi:hypothetical protein
VRNKITIGLSCLALVIGALSLYEEWGARFALSASDELHLIGKLEATKKAAELGGLEKRGVIEIWKETNQYRLKPTAAAPRADR